MISRDEGLGFSSIWGESYDLNFGIYQDTNTGIYFMQYMAYCGATVINVVLMLNLLISILGDSYERFQIEQVIVDIKEKARISMELQLMMFWSNKKSLLKCIRLCNYAFQGEEDHDWEGRIRFLDKKLDRNFSGLVKSNEIAEVKASDSSKLIETKIAPLEGRFASIESTIKLVDSKIRNLNISLEDKIASVDSKMSEISVPLEGKIDGIRTLLDEKITSVEGKISEINISMEGKMNELNQKLAIILNIISK